MLGIGVNIGTFNPSYTVATDGVTFNDTTYDFEVGRRPSSKDECKDGGWQTFDDPAFKNQGDCVSFVNAQRSVGKTQRISRPRPRWPRASTVPPAEATTCFTIASPSPVPRVCRERSAR